MLIIRIKDMLFHSLVYFVGWGFSAVLRLLLLPVFTSYLSPVEYGILAILDSAVVIGKIIFTVGINSAIVRFYHEANSRDSQNGVIATGMVTLLCSAFTGFIALYIFREGLADLILGIDGSVEFVCLAFGTTLFGLLMSGGEAYLVAEKRSTFLASYSAVFAGVNAVANIILVVGLDFGVSGMLWGNFLCAAMFTSFLCGFVVKKVGFRLDTKLLKPMARFGIPLIPAMLAATGMHYLDRFFLRAYSSMQEVGLYSLAYQFPFMLNAIFLSCFERVWGGSTIFEIAKEPDAVYQYSRIATYAMAFLGFFLFLVAIGSRNIVRVFAAPSYAEASTFMPFIALGVWIYAFHTFAKVGVILVKKTKYFALNYVLALLVNVAANFALVPVFGAMGAAWATIVTYACFSLGGFFMYRNVYPVKIEWARLGVVLGLGATLAVIRSTLTGSSFLAEIAVDTGFAISFPLGLIFLPGFLTRGERLMLRKLLMRAVGLLRPRST